MTKTRELVRTSLFPVLIAICSWISIPAAVPFTMQTFAVFLALNYLGGKNGVKAVAAYLLLGLIGVPVYANGTAGIGVLLGSTGGYMIGWIFSGMVMQRIEKRWGNSVRVQMLSMLAGLLICYAMGTAWFMLVYARTSGPVGLWLALSWCVFPFVIPDMIKLGLVLTVSRRIRQLRLIR